METGLTRFLLIGSERSGTTFLRLLLDHHPQMACLAESQFLVQHRDACRGASAAALRARLATDRSFTDLPLDLPADTPEYDYDAAIDHFFVQHAERRRVRMVGATVHGHFEEMPLQFPEMLYVHLLRDPRPVAASTLNMGWAGNLYTAARHWSETIRRVSALREQVPAERWLEVRFEQLAEDTETHLARLCEFLGQPFDPAMMSYSETTTYNPPEKDAGQRWRERLSPAQIREAELGAGPQLEQCGYERMFPATEPGWLGRLGLGADDWFGRTRFRVRRFGFGLLLARKLLGLVGVRDARLESRYERIRESHIR